ncbi:FGGY-family carbohydrate kinase [uncultured Clostridium sp.]|uniref:FGGY-family carbohydrate kinase n=1 Tax=uncultured Clostridium sp. TaxID=59620 RepID=UPI0028F06B25|nr:FGGY-family carbohydrate kinase [uncultured Clostridium sp.]
MKKYLIGVDAGTSLVKSVLFDLQGHELFVSKQKTQVLTPRQDWAEQDMYSVFQATLNTLRELVDESNISSKDVLAIGVTAQGDGCWMIDKNGDPIRNAILWSDGRAGNIINEWQESGVSDEAYKICGSSLFPGAQNAILKWLKHNEEENLSKVAHAFYCKDWLRYKLTGVVATDESDASLPHVNIRTKTYSQELFKLYGIDDLNHLFPEIIPSTKAFAPLLKNVADFTGLMEGTPVVISPFDVISASIGVGAINDGNACSIVGTTCFNEVTMSSPDITPLNVGMTIAHGIPNKWMRALGAMMGTPNIDWCIDNICALDKEYSKNSNINLFSFLEEKVQNVPVGSNGVIYHPYLSPGGERAPFVKPTARAQFTGICMDHNRYDLLRAVYEGVAMEMLDCYKHMPGEINEVRLSGGGASSSFWCQMFSDATGKIMKVPHGSEFGAKGAIINASVAINLFSSFEDAVENMVRIERQFNPNMDNNLKYEKLYDCYRDVYKAQWDLWDKLNSTVKSFY